MTVALRAMSPGEFADWYDEHIAAYAEDNVRAGRSTAQDALTKSVADHAELLPDGLATTTEAFYVVLDDDQPVGVLWLGLKRAPDQAWVFDVEVRPEHRGKGLGRAAMLLAEDECRSRGIRAIGLNVFGHNDIARALYDSLGYLVTAQQMTKDL